MARRVVSIITPHYSPEITAAAHRMEIAARTLASSYKVHVFTLTEKGKRTDTYDMKCDANLTVHYIPQRNYSKSLFFIRALFEIWYSFKLIRKSNSVKSDLALITVPYIFLLPLAVRFCHARKKIADVRDLVWHYLPNDTFLRRRIRYRLTHMMNRSLNRFNAITLTNEAEKRWLMERAGFAESKLTVIPNGLSIEKYKQLTEVKYTTHPQKFTIAYIGNIGTSQNFYNLLDAVKEMKDVRVNLIGDGGDYARVQSYISSNKINNVFLTGKLKWRRTLPYYQTANLLFASLRENYDTAIPSKLYEYLATGLPIVYEGNGAAVHFLRNYQNTAIVPCCDTASIEKAIWKFKHQSPQRSHKNIRDIGRLFVREKLSSRFVELAAHLLNEKALSTVYVEDILQGTEF